jgi:hypothetical protein
MQDAGQINKQDAFTLVRHELPMLIFPLRHKSKKKGKEIEPALF